MNSGVSGWCTASSSCMALEKRRSSTDTHCCVPTLTPVCVVRNAVGVEVLNLYVSILSVLPGFLTILLVLILPSFLPSGSHEEGDVPR